MHSPEHSSLETALRVARLVRHEVGDLLQSVYTATAVLQERLPPSLTEDRRLLADLKGRAEWCKLELDAVVALLLPAAPAPAPIVELGAAFRPAVEQARLRHPGLPIGFDGEPNLLVRAEDQALRTMALLLVQTCAQAARQWLEVQLRREEGRPVCTIDRDGVAVPAEQLVWLDRPFATLHNAALGLALALARRVIATSGAVEVSGRAGGGVLVRLRFLPLAT